MMLDPRHCYEALAARDVRFDGVFFVGVSSTGIYCRPVCPVRIPGFERCSFYPSAASAEKAGFRPCLRCRPELAPGSSSVEASARLARAAAARIDAGALSEGTVADLARELGVGARQLRRVVQSELGVSPSALAQTRRLLLAKQLLTDTDLRVVDIAFASGFSSVRQFNRTFRQRYRMSPSALRKKSRPATLGDSAGEAVGDSVGAPPGDSIVVKLGIRPPIAWTGLLDFLSARAAQRAERRQGDRYQRTVHLDAHRGWLSAIPDAAQRNLHVTLSLSLTPVLPQLLARLRRLFDLDANPMIVDRHLADDPLMAPRVQTRPGLRVPGAFDGFELALRAILGQQISVAAASTLYARIVAAFGAEVATPIAGLDRCVPRAEDLALRTVDEIRALGLPTRRAETVHRLAAAVADGTLALDATGDIGATRASLLAIPGIGPWTCEYIAMRALGDPDAIPASDLGLLRASDCDNPRDLLRQAEAWRPWRAYACLHLWT